MLRAFFFVLGLLLGVAVQHFVPATFPFLTGKYREWKDRPPQCPPNYAYCLKETPNPAE